MDRQRRRRRRRDAVVVPITARRPQLRYLVAALVATFVVLSGLAVAGELPDGIQRRVASVVSHLGIDLPSPADDDAPDHRGPRSDDSDGTSGGTGGNTGAGSTGSGANGGTTDGADVPAGGSLGAVGGAASTTLPATGSVTVPGEVPTGPELTLPPISLPPISLPPELALPPELRCLRSRSRSSRCLRSPSRPSCRSPRSCRVSDPAVSRRPSRALAGEGAPRGPWSPQEASVP